jgi:plastocyanin
VRGDKVKKKLLVLVMFALVLAMAACGGDDGGSESEEGSGGGDAGASDSVTVTTVDFAFDPSDVSVAAGGSIELTNEDDTKHSLTAEEAGIDQDVDAGSSTTVDVGDAEPGSYDFICKYHPDMTGTLEITE